MNLSSLELDDDDDDEMLLATVSTMIGGGSDVVDVSILIRFVSLFLFTLMSSPSDNVLESCSKRY